MDADTFLSALGGTFTFQTFDDTGRNRGNLSRILHGPLERQADTLAKLNSDGAGVFVMVNEGDGKGRRALNVRRVRAYFIDMDGAPLRPVQDAPLPPHIVIESSPGRWHCYWLVTDAPLGDFKRVQKALAERFAADLKVCDLPRVMRLPGFMHNKAQAFRVRIHELHSKPRYNSAAFLQAFGLARPTLGGTIPEGERNSTLYSLGCGFAGKGFDADAINQRLQMINTECCQPPLCVTEVQDIAANAVTYGSHGYTSLPHVLLDSPEWKALPPPAHDVILTAYRRYNGSNNGNIALTWADFDGRPGFSKKATFYKHRSRVENSGILVRTADSTYSQNGRKPALFAISPKWLPNYGKARKGNLAQGPKREPLSKTGLEGFETPKPQTANAPKIEERKRA